MLMKNNYIIVTDLDSTLLDHHTYKEIHWHFASNKSKNTVLDFTSGSCTTGVACLNTNRNFVGNELNEKYFQLGVDRIDELNLEQRFRSNILTKL